MNQQDTNISLDHERKLFGNSVRDLFNEVDAAMFKASKAGLSLETIVGALESAKHRAIMETFREAGI